MGRPSTDASERSLGVIIVPETRRQRASHHRAVRPALERLTCEMAGSAG